MQTKLEQKATWRELEWDITQTYSQAKLVQDSEVEYKEETLMNLTYKMLKIKHQGHLLAPNS